MNNIEKNKKVYIKKREKISVRIKTISEIKYLLRNEIPKESLFREYEPQESWYSKKEIISGLHGTKHEARVMVWQEILSRLLIKKGEKLNQEALRWAAVTHDTQRIEDGFDYLHGERSAKWVEKNMKLLVSAETLKTIIYINKWHVPNDSHAPQMTPELAVFKDADALDRVRIEDLNPDMLRYQISKKLLVKAAEDLYRLSKDKSSYSEVIKTAVKLGLVKEK